MVHAYLLLVIFATMMSLQVWGSFYRMILLLKIMNKQLDSVSKANQDIALNISIFDKSGSNISIGN